MIDTKSSMEFLDSSFIIALISEQDEFHEKALIESDRLEKDKVKILTTDAVLIEIASALARPPYRSFAISAVEMLRSSEATSIVPLTSKLYNEAWQLYKSRPDKSWSMVDCISFIVMDQYKIDIALTSDQHFEQAGFKAQLKK